MKTLEKIARRAGIVVMAAATLLVASCFETEQEFTLNPDGSGKVVHECRFSEFNLDFGGGAGQPDEESLKRAVADILEKSKGVEAWDDVDFERLDDGRVRFRGTALFADISKLDIHNQSMMSFAWTRDPSGNAELAMKLKQENDDRVEDDAAKLENAPPEDAAGRRRWLAAERGKFQQQRPMMLSILSGIRHSATFRLPGVAGETKQFEDAGEGHLRIGFEGAKFLAALDAVVADDAWLLSNGLENDKPIALDDALTVHLFGAAGLPVASRSAVREPLFDYQAELAAARANADALRERLGAAGARVAPPAQGGPLAGARIVGMRLSRAVDPALELRPFNHDPGLTFALICEFDGAILSISDQSAVETALTKEGVSLLPKSEFQRSLRWPNFSPCRTHAMFDVTLEPPPPGAESLRDLAGTIHYSVASGSREVELGLPKIALKERGDELGAEITELKDGWREDGPHDLGVRMNLPLDDLKAMFLVDENGRVELERRGYSSGGNVTTYNFELPRGFAPNARLVAEVHDEIQNFTTQFILRDIPLPSLTED